METDAQPTSPNPKTRWFYPTPGRLLVVLLAVEGVLLLSERWFPKGWAVLIAVAAVGLFLLLMLIWFITSLIFRLHFQFSIRSLLLLTIVVAIPSSWLAVEMKWTKEQREVVAAIEKAGGSGRVGEHVGYDYQFDASGQFIEGVEPPAPAWMRKILGDDFFQTVIYAYLENDASILYLKDLNKIRFLSLASSDITDKGLEQLNGFIQLHSLGLFSFPNITDAGLERLKSLTQLQELYLGGTQVTDTRLEHLKGLTKLQRLVLIETKVTDEGVKKLQQALPHCSIQR